MWREYSNVRVETVNIINLKRRVDLREAQLKTWMALGYDHDQIVFHDAMDGMVYGSQEAIADEAIADGFLWFKRIHDYMDDDIWMGLGELACMWSIARLLRHISDLAGDSAYIYALADRYSKIGSGDLNDILSNVSDFRFLQFRGCVPQKNDWHYRETWRKEPKFSPVDGIEHCALKIGDGVLAMTPEGAQWMQEACEPHLIGQPYEGALYFATLTDTPKGVYSVYHKPDETATSEGYYGTYNDHSWEGQYDFGSELGASDIARVNIATKTGTYGNIQGGTNV